MRHHPRSFFVGGSIREHAPHCRLLENCAAKSLDLFHMSSALRSQTGRRFEQLLLGAGLDDLALVDDHHPVGTREEM
jgi:hypothetical protein